MKTKIKGGVAIILMLAFISPLKAQVEFCGGLVLGVSTGSVSIRDLGKSFKSSIEGDNILGFEGGAYAKMLMKPVYIKPALLYDYRMGQVSYHDLSDISQTSDFIMHKLEIPLMLGVHIAGPLNIEAGPVYNYIFSITDSYRGNNIALGRNGLGYRGGIVGEFSDIIHVSVAYQGTYYAGDSDNATLREPYKIVLSLGICLGNSEKYNK